MYDLGAVLETGDPLLRDKTGGPIRKQAKKH